jgi:hypothetical protein
VAKRHSRRGRFGYRQNREHGGGLAMNNTTNNGEGWVSGWDQELVAGGGWAENVAQSPPKPEAPEPAGDEALELPTNPARLALGVAILAGDRLRVGIPNDTFVVGVGLAQQTMAEMRGLARRALKPAGRAVDWATKQASMAAQQSNAGLFARTRSRVGQLVVEARNVGRATIAAGRQDATAFVRASVAEGMAWAETQAVPRIVDSLVPHLVESVVPRIIDGVMPEIRSSVLPAVVEDLANDPKLRDLVAEQSRGAIEDAAHTVRSATAHADDRVENAFRRLVGGGGQKPEPPAPNG